MQKKNEHTLKWEKKNEHGDIFARLYLKFIGIKGILVDEQLLSFFFFFI